MAQITKPVTREIVDDFAKEIQQRRTQTAKPAKEVINFRTDIKDGIERWVWRVPIDLLRFRKDNGRIASDVANYERVVGPIDEKDDQGQALIAKFLLEKDPERTVDLRSSVLHAGQLEPAIVTCDGFLINGNRRKMVMDRLRKEHPENENLAWMKCVILPGKGEEGGPPTLYEIEKIENRYQLQSDGKSEYYGFDRALSIKRKIDIGLSLEDQLRDDPRYAEATPAQLQKALREYTKDYLDPLKCVERYLKQFNRSGLYRTISQGMSDPEGRWQALKDYTNYTYNRLENPKQRVQLGIEEDEVGSIEEAAFDIIRLRTVPDMPKVHVIMRDLPKYCGTKEGKREIMKIAEDVEPVLPKMESVDEKGEQLPLDAVDAKWAAKNKQAIIHRLKKARSSHESNKEKTTPLDLLEGAYEKLTSEAMDVQAIAVADFARARTLASEIQTRAAEIESEIYDFDKKLKKLTKKS
jgi:hypothetical protein